MPLIQLKIPAGVRSVGTDLESTGRWLDSNLVRWTNGSLRPVGGWLEKYDASTSFTAAPRKMHSWNDNSGVAHIALGSASELIHVDESGQASDITPAGLVSGANNGSVGSAFGGGSYGASYYGTERIGSGVFQEADTWALDNWGEYLVGCLTSDGKLYEWQLNTATPAAQITNAPINNKTCLVTEERFIFALGADGNPRKVQWCDREDNTEWTPEATNEAGDIELQTNGEIMTGVRVRGQALILTNVDAHVANYIGSPYVYGFERVGTACGTASRIGVVATDVGAFWMGTESFFMFNGSSVIRLPCEVQDRVFDSVNRNQLSKVFAVHDTKFGEIWWFYPSSETTEIDSYVAFDYNEQHWTVGSINRTCGVPRGVFEHPYWVSKDGVIYEHERLNLPHGDAVPFAETAPFNLGSGDQLAKAVNLIGDEDFAGQVNVSFKAKFHPNDIEYSYGPYTLNGGITSIRFTGRQIRMRVEATGNDDFRVGVMRMELQSGGKR